VGFSVDALPNRALRPDNFVAQEFLGIEERGTSELFAEAKN
jgi:hypothetical protein